jgi:hypothetical protein
MKRLVVGDVERGVGEEVTGSSGVNVSMSSRRNEAGTEKSRTLSA